MLLLAALCSSCYGISRGANSLEQGGECRSDYDCDDGCVCARGECAVMACSYVEDCPAGMRCVRDRDGRDGACLR